MKRDYDLNILKKAFEVGDIVYVLDTATVKGKRRKLTPPWKGPGLIVKKIYPHMSTRLHCTGKVLLIIMAELN